jgi:hypothetical protein
VLEDAIERLSYLALQHQECGNAPSQDSTDPMQSLTTSASTVDGKAHRVKAHMVSLDMLDQI